jgi:hypothetical protein
MVKIKNNNNSNKNKNKNKNRRESEARKVLECCSESAISTHRNGY